MSDLDNTTEEKEAMTPQEYVAATTAELNKRLMRPMDVLALEEALRRQQLVKSLIGGSAITGLGGILGALRSRTGTRMDGAGHGALRALGAVSGLATGGLAGVSLPSEAARKGLTLPLAVGGAVGGHNLVKRLVGKSRSEEEKAKEKAEEEEKEANILTDRPTRDQLEAVNRLHNADPLAARLRHLQSPSTLANNAIYGSAIGGLAGALRSSEGHKGSGAGYGALRGVGAAGGAAVGGSLLPLLVARLLNKPELIEQSMRPNPSAVGLSLLGTGLGGVGGYYGAKGLFGKSPSEEAEEEEKEAYAQGVMSKLPQTKEAFLAWGGGEVGAQPKGRGVGAALGYTNALGLVPIPYGSVDIGGPEYGFQLGATPDEDSPVGISPLIGLRLGHPRKSGITRQFPRGVPDVIYDKLRGRTKEDAILASYPDLETDRAERAEKKKKSSPKGGDKDKAEKGEEGTDKEKAEDEEKEAYAQGVMSKLADFDPYRDRIIFGDEGDLITKQELESLAEYFESPEARDSVAGAILRDPSVYGGFAGAGAGLGALLGAIKSPKGLQGAAGAGYGALRGAGAGLGALVGGIMGERVHRTFADPSTPGNKWTTLAALTGTGLGGVGGYHAAKGIFGKSPSEKAKEEEKEAYAQGVMSKLAQAEAGESPPVLVGGTPIQGRSVGGELPSQKPPSMVTRLFGEMQDNPYLRYGLGAAGLGAALGAARSPGFAGSGARHGAFRGLGALGGGILGYKGGMKYYEPMYNWLSSGDSIFGNLSDKQLGYARYLPLLLGALGMGAGYQGAKLVGGRSEAERAKALRERERLRLRALGY